MYSTLFATAYFGLFRVSELTTTNSNHAVKVCDVQLGQNKKKILFILCSSKTHGKFAHPQMIKITTKEFKNGQYSHVPADARQSFCPYNMLRNFLTIRPKYRSKTEPFFVFKDFTPVMDVHMRSTLHLMLKLMGRQEDLFNCHSFRIGRSCDLLKFGVSVDTIKKLGRWSSNAVYAYLRQWTM